MSSSTFGFAPRSPTAMQEMLDRFQTQTQTWQDYLFFLSMLPEFVRLKWGFEPGTADEIEECGRLLWLQSTQAAWLDHLVTKEQAPEPKQVPVPMNLAETEAAVVEVRAQLSKAVLDLARATFQQVPFLKTTNRPTPESLWFAWEVQNFENMVWHSGLVTGQATNWESKETVDARCRTIAKILEEANPRKSFPSTMQTENADELLGNLEALLCSAYTEAVNDPYFKHSRAYVGFQKALRAWSRECRTKAFWILPQFENGKRLPTGRNTKREPREVTP